MKDHGAFDGIAGGYDLYRATYPGELIAAFSKAVNQQFSFKGDDPTILDLGSGSGISTRLLGKAFDRSFHIIGIEPGKDMLETARMNPDTSPNVRYMHGSAEAIPMAVNSALGIFVAQAIQWFDRPAFYKEAQRVLKTGGVLGIIQNNREWKNSPFFDDYETLLETYSPGYSRHYRDIDIETELNQAGFGNACERYEVRWRMSMNYNDFPKWSFTSSKVKKAAQSIGKERFLEKLDELYREHHKPGEPVSLPYLAELFVIIKG